MTKTSNTNPNILVTGGSGFLGKRIVDEFLAPDSLIKPGKLNVLDIKEYDGQHKDSIEFMLGDIRDANFVKKACRDIDLVVHAAAIIDWGTKSKEEVLAINVEGTKNVIEACKANGVEYLIYTSSLDAVFTGKPLVNIDETQPYPDTHHTIYCESKKLAEIEVKQATNEKLKTIILRPSDIYGEDDPYHMDSLVDVARSGFYIRLGDGKSRNQHVYVGNMAYAHVRAAAELMKGNDKISGEIYFITDGEPENFFKFFDPMVEGAGYKLRPKNLWLPRGFAYSLASISEFFAALIRPIVKTNPKLSRFAVTYISTDFIFSADKAKRDFGFKPKYDKKEAAEGTISFYKERRTSSKN
jgi:sterol-4alpha-carboxylate 3-dehydrogenase (decarboxylating)